MIATLTYHSIDDSGSPVSVSPAAFDSHLAWLTSGRVRVLPLDDLVKEPADAADAVALTFDDGFRNTADPLRRLIDAGFVPTVFAVTRHAGGTNAWGGQDQPGIPTLPLFDWDELADLHRRDVRIEAHTRTHPHLTKVSPSQLADEIEGSREDLERRLGAKPGHFAYPYGDVDDAAAACAASAFVCSHTTRMSVLGGGGDRARLPRLDMYYFRALGAIEGFGTPAFARQVAVIRARRALKSWFTRASK